MVTVNFTTDKDQHADTSGKQDQNWNGVADVHDGVLHSSALQMIDFPQVDMITKHLRI